MTVTSQRNMYISCWKTSRAFKLLKSVPTWKDKPWFVKTKCQIYESFCVHFWNTFFCWTCIIKKVCTYWLYSKRICLAKCNINKQSKCRWNISNLTFTQNVLSVSFLPFTTCLRRYFVYRFGPRFHSRIRNPVQDNLMKFDDLVSFNITKKSYVVCTVKLLLSSK